jgi:flavin-dependent dehydrogenase
VDDARLIYKNRVVHVKNKPEFIVFHRMEFDAYLAAQTRQRGATIIENTPVDELRVDETGVTAITPEGPVRARSVVGADGSKGLTRRQVIGHDGPSRVARLLEVVTPAPANAPHFSERRAVFDFTPAKAELQGYVWDFPSRVSGKPHYNRGVYDARFSPSRPKAKLPQLLAQSMEAWDGRQEVADWMGHPIHWFSPRSRFAIPRVLLVGDAAGADPLFGEGIGPALGYGEVAARAIQQAFERSDFGFHDYKRRLLLSPVGRYLLLRWGVAWWGYRLSGEPWFMHTIWTLGKVLSAMTPAGSPLDLT